MSGVFGTLAALGVAFSTASCGGGDGNDEELCASYAISRCSWIERACGVTPPDCLGEVQRTCLDGFPGADNDYDVRACAEYFDESNECTDSDDWPDVCPKVTSSPDAGMVDCDVEDCHGRFAVAWVLRSGGVEVTCADVGASVISVLSVLRGTTQGVDDIFSCSAASGTTGLFPAGDYTVTVRVLDNTDAVLRESAPVDATIDANETVNLGEFTFDL